MAEPTQFLQQQQPYFQSYYPYSQNPISTAPINFYQTTNYTNLYDYSMYSSSNYHLYPQNPLIYTLATDCREVLRKMDEICKAALTRLEQMESRFDKQKQSKESFNLVSRTQSNNEVQGDSNSEKTKQEDDNNPLVIPLTESDLLNNDDDECLSKEVGHDLMVVEKFSKPMRMDYKVFGVIKTWRKRKKKIMRRFDIEFANNGMRNLVTLCATIGVRRNVIEGKLGVNTSTTSVIDQSRSDVPTIGFFLCDGKESFDTKSGFYLPISGGDTGHRSCLEEMFDMECLLDNQFGNVDDSLHYFEFCSTSSMRVCVIDTRNYLDASLLCCEFYAKTIVGQKINGELSNSKGSWEMVSKSLFEDMFMTDYSNFLRKIFILKGPQLSFAICSVDWLMAHSKWDPGPLTQGNEHVVFNYDGVLYPASLMGTDLYIFMIDGWIVAGWVAGLIEAEDATLAQPICNGVTTTDLVLTLTQMLQNCGGVKKFVKSYGNLFKDVIERRLKNVLVMD